MALTKDERNFLEARIKELNNALQDKMTELRKAESDRKMQDVETDKILSEIHNRVELKSDILLSHIKARQERLQGLDESIRELEDRVGKLRADYAILQKCLDTGELP